MIDLDELVRRRRLRDDTAREWLTSVNRRRAAAGNQPARLVTEVHSIGGYHVAPIELIAALAVARQASLRDPTDPDALSLRLLGTAIVNLTLFDAAADPLCLDVDTESMRGRARGLISEDLGISVGVHIATHTLNASSPGPRYVIDVDNPPPRLRPASQHRPDYLVLSGIPGSGTGTVEFVVECKGRSRSGAPVAGTLAKALDQAEQTYFAGGHRPRPLAVGILRGSPDLEVLALEPHPGHDPAPLRLASTASRRDIAQDERPDGPGTERTDPRELVRGARLIDRIADKQARKGRSPRPQTPPTAIADLEIDRPLQMDVTLQDGTRGVRIMYGMMASAAAALESPGRTERSFAQTVLTGLARAELESVDPPQFSSEDRISGLGRTGLGLVQVGDATHRAAITVTAAGYVLAVTDLQGSS